MTIQFQVPIASLPINLVCQGTLVAFVRTSDFKTLFENSPDGATFYNDSFSIADEVFEYNKLYQYKEIPVMLKWLIAQKLQGPSFQHF